jgi:glycosyltransferase involved in cell wall biosynthesis
VTGQVSPAVLSGSQLHLSYVGLLEIRRGLLHVLEVLRSHPEWTLELAGIGRDARAILDAATQMPNVHWHGEVAYDRALSLNASADVLFATYDPEVPNHRFSSPNKIFEAMMLGKPVIVARDTNADRLVEKESCGLVVTYGDRNELEAALSNLAQDPGLRHRLGNNGRRAYETTYSWERMRDSLISFYQEVVA